MNDRVEQVFLIHRNTSLLLAHVSVVAEPADAHQVAAMLMAIRGFADGSLGAPESLDTFTLGDLTVCIEEGPDAVLAAVVRGKLPPGWRASFRDALETIHLEQGPELRSFNGDAAPFQSCRQVLETCLIPQFRDRAGRGQTQ
jgi:OOP family OmpA-OmpF porin